MKVYLKQQTVEIPDAIQMAMEKSDKLSQMVIHRGERKNDSLAWRVTRREAKRAYRTERQNARKAKYYVNALSEC